MYVPFSIPVDSLTAQGVKIGELIDTHQWDNNGDGNLDSLTIEFVILKSGSTEANFPYIIKPSKQTTLTLNLNNATIHAAKRDSINCSSTKQIFTFVGTYEGISGKEMYGNNYYALNSIGGLSRAASEAGSLKPQRWFLRIENRDGTSVPYYAPTIRYLIGEDEEETTDILSISNTGGKKEKSIYRLDGIHMTSDNLKPGIYVCDGKKLVIR
ncbi:MAG: hypothetical protein K6E86_02050 [Bacteroidales bacterium]|nr:hypothetical protein [Bacteroidales bacterium]